MPRIPPGITTSSSNLQALRQSTAVIEWHGSLPGQEVLKQNACRLSEAGLVRTAADGLESAISTMCTGLATVSLVSPVSDAVDHSLSIMYQMQVSVYIYRCQLVYTPIHPIRAVL